MSYYKKDGFQFDGFRNDLMEIESNRIEECKEYALKNNITKFSFFDSHGYHFDHLEFLNNDRLKVEELLVISDKIKDISPLNKLKNLSYLSLSVNKARCKPISIKNSISSLVELRTNFLSKINDVTSLPKLEVLACDINLPEKDLRSFKGYPRLKELLLTGGNYQSLAGLEHCKQLKIVHLFSSRSLRNIDPLWMLPNIKEIVIESCKKINFKVNFPMPCLEDLNVRDSGEIDSLSSIKDHAIKLKELSFWGTTVLDADMTPLLEMDQLTKGFHFKDHKNYNLKLKKAEELFGNVTKEEILELKKLAIPIVSSGNKIVLPTENWKEAGYPNKHQIKSVEKELKRFLKNLAKQTNTTDRLKEFEISIKNMDKIQLENGMFINTPEREQLASFYNEVAHVVKIDEYDDITWLWRAEW